MARTISTTETAKLVRKALKRNFAGVKFSVRSSKYAGGSSVSVYWTDGPTAAAVDKVIKAFEGSDFDGMQDLKTYKDSVVSNEDGTTELVHFGADYVFSQRSMSECVQAEIASSLRAFAAEVASSKYGEVVIPAGAGVDCDAPLKVGVVRPEDNGGSATWSIHFDTEWAYTLVGRMFALTAYDV